MTYISTNSSAIAHLTEHKIPMELCPKSNVRTGIVHAMSEHIIREYFEGELTISVNTDDPKMFGTSLDREYGLLVQQCGFTKEEICRLILLGIESSWLSQDQKNSLARSFSVEPSWPGYDRNSEHRKIGEFLSIF